ncbi:MAG: hypothetical protein NTZ13_03310 [Candidatus Parcubacteria bacterium]|nr:hypothetical protein [Candidatus Parcubacteria bacterium]
MKNKKTEVVAEDQNKQRNILIVTIIAGLLFGFSAGRMWTRRGVVEVAVKNNKVATTTLAAAVTSATTEKIVKKTVTPVKKVVAVKKETPAPVKKVIAVKKEIPVPVKVVPKKETPVVAQKKTEGNFVSVSGQAAGSSVALSKVKIVKDGWVAIREDEEGEFGRILGAAWFPTGTNENVSVELLRNTQSGGKYYTVLYVDNGDHQFSTKTDILVMENGKPASQVFVTK